MLSRNRMAELGRYFILCALFLVAVLAASMPVTSIAAPAVTRWSGEATMASIAGRFSLLVPPVFGPNVRANSDSTTNGQHEPSLAVSRVNTNVVVVASKDYRNGNVKQVWINVSTDGGATWPEGKQIHMPGIPGDLPIQSDPVVMARDDGRIYVACLGTNSSQNRGGVFITWTDDNGTTWQSPSVPVFYPENALDDKDWFAVDNNPASPYYHRMYMMYAPGAGYVAEQHSTDGGLTWTTRQQIGTSNTEYTYPVVSSDGTVYNFMMLNWGPDRPGTIQLTKSANGGATWTTPSTVETALQPSSPIRPSDQFRFFAILSAAVDPNTGTLYVAWTDKRNISSNGIDVVYVKSTDGGNTWSPVTRLSHDPAGVVRDHITPMLTVGADSRLHAFWLDRRLDVNNRLFDSWYSSSTDQGATWESDTRVSDVSQDLNIGFPPGSGNAAGDYWGLDTSQDAVYVAWNDTRLNSQQDILVSKGLMQGGATPTTTATNTPLPSSTSTPTLVATGTATSSATSLATFTLTVSPVAASPTTTSTSTAAATITSTAVPTAQCSIGWRVIPGQDRGTLRNGLADVEAISPENVWAVGSYSNDSDFYIGRQTLIEHWDGTSWSVVPSPNASADGNFLYSIDSISANDIWAVGEFDGTPGPGSTPKTLTMHWNGSVWAIVPSPNVAVMQWGTLHGVSAAASNDVWAVGHSFGDPSYPLVLHWNGTAWSVVPAPIGLGAACYAFGVDALSSNDVWASGYCDNAETPPDATFTMHWNGSQWTYVPSPNPGNAQYFKNLSAIEAISATDVWAVGVYDVFGPEITAARTLVEHFDGTAWSVVPSPNVATYGNELSGLSVISPGDVWAVGNSYHSQTDSKPLTIHWNGTQWDMVANPDPGPIYSFLSGVSALSAQDVWAVGGTARQQGLLDSRTLIEHYSADQFSDVSRSNDFYPYVQCLACRGIISGYADGTFRPNNQVTRGQLAKIVSNSAGFAEDPNPQIFADVPPSNTFYQWINRLTGRGYMTGYVCGGPGEPCVNNMPYFRPSANATRGQTAKIVANAAQFNEPPVGQTFEDVPLTHAFYPFIQRLAIRGVMGGYPCGGPGEPCTTFRPYFRPNNDVTRGQSAKIVSNSFFPGCQTR